MEQAILGAVLKGVINIAGPVARTLREKRATKLGAELQQLLSPESSSAILISARLRDLIQDDLELSQVALAQTIAFVHGAEGSQLIRLVSIHSLSRWSSPDTGAALDRQAAALIRLSPFDLNDHADDIGYALRVVIAEATTVVMAAIEKRSQKIADELRQAAKGQARERELLTAAFLDVRTETIVRLSEDLPSSLEADMREYLDAIHASTRELRIPVVNKEHVVPIDEAFQTPVIRGSSPDEEEVFAGPRVSDSNPLLSHLSSGPRVVLLGDPGGGKSTTVQSAVNRLSGDALLGNFDAIPFLITLRQYARALEQDSDTGIFEYLVSTIQRTHSCTDFAPASLKYFLGLGRCVIFFDGLDEILNVGTKRRVVEQIAAFGHRYSGNAMAVTARSVGYSEVPLDSSFLELELAEFGAETVAGYAHWFFRESTVKRADVDVDVDEFLRQSSEIADIRSNPLLLGVLCSLYANNRTVPSNRADLYSRCAQMLFEDWDASKEIRPSLAEPAAAESAIRSLALQVYSSGQEEIAAGDLVRLLEEIYEYEHGLDRFEARALASETFRLWRGRRWILAFDGERDGVDYFRFTHRTFLEYFAADQFVYECPTGEQLFSRQASNIRARNGTVFTLLTTEMMSRRTKDSLDHFVEAALEWTRTAPSEDGTPEAKCNVLTTCVEALASGRASFEAKRAVVVAALTLLTDEVSQLQDARDGEGLLHWPDLERLVAPIKSVEAIRTTERVRLVEVIDRYLQQGLAGHRFLDHLKVLFVLKDMPTFFSWATVSPDWIENLTSALGALVDDISDRGVSLADVEPLERWVGEKLLSEVLTEDERIVESLGLYGLFEVTSSIPSAPDRETAAGVPAHAILLRLLGFSNSAHGRTWTETTISAFSETLVRLACADPSELTTNWPSENFERGNGLLRVTEPTLEPSLRSSTNRFAAAAIIAKLVHQDDREFLEGLLKLCRSTSELDGIAHVIEALLYPGDWDGSADVYHLLHLDDEHRALLPDPPVPVATHLRGDLRFIDQIDGKPLAPH